MQTNLPYSPDLRAVDDAVRILRNLRKALAPGSLTVWKIVDHATQYLECQLREALAADSEFLSVRSTIPSGSNEREISEASMRSQLVA